MRIILASGSSRRHVLFKRICPCFEVIVANVDESLSYSDPIRQVEQLAMQKAQAVYSTLPVGEKALVIGSDTLCYMDGKYYGKPESRDGAKAMLAQLSGKTHYVYTGVALIGNGKREFFYDSSAVTFKALTPSQIEEYVQRFSPLDKAGAYGIQDDFVVESYTGSYENIMGLPIDKLKEYLAHFA